MSLRQELAQAKEVIARETAARKKLEHENSQRFEHVQKFLKLRRELDSLKTAYEQSQINYKIERAKSQESAAKCN